MASTEYQVVLEFEIPGEPMPAPRPKVVFQRGRAIAYLPESYQQEKLKIQAYAHAAAMQNKDFHCLNKKTPVLLGMRFFRSEPKKGGDYPVGRPDWDNYEKTVLDALQGVLYDNDSQVVGPLGWPASGKFYAENGRCRTEVTVAIVR